MAKASLSLVLPDYAVLFANELNRAMLPQHFKTILDKAAFQQNSAGTYQHLLDLFSPDTPANTDLPMAELRQGKAYSICADPCYLHPDRDKLLLFYRDLGLSFEEAQAFATFLQPLFDDLAATLQVQTADQWLLRLDQTVKTRFSAKEGIHGQAVTDFLPTGYDAENWVRLWNEIQMQLFDCPLNQAREAAGKAPINSLWFWGNAALPQHWQSWSQVSGHHDVLQRLVTLSKSRYEPTLNHFDGVNAKQLHIEAFAAEQDWQPQLDALLENWLQPAIKALKKMQLKELKLIVPEWGCYRLTPLSVWRFW